jgi:hypothetical protein
MPKQATFGESRGLVRSPQQRPGGFGTMQASHLAALQTKHAVLDQRLAQESQRPAPDTIVIAELKKQKLKLKQELAQL